VNRRDFLKSSALIAAANIPSLLTASAAKSTAPVTCDVFVYGSTPGG